MTSQSLAGALPTIEVVDDERVKAVREAVREITKKFDARYFSDCVRDREYPGQILQALSDSGLLGLTVPEEFGGAGGGFIEEVALMEALATAGISPFFIVVSTFARIPVIRHGQGPEAQRYIAASMAADRRPCFALTEPDAGTNSFAMRTRASRVDGGWRINGQKIFITGADRSDQMLVVARTDIEGARRAELSLFILDTAARGVTLRPMHIPAASPSTHSTVFFDDVEVPDSAVVGEPSAGIGYLFSALNPERMMVAAMALGLGDCALRVGSEYARQRAPFGKPVGSYQSVAHPLARAKVQVEAARSLLYQAAQAYEEGRDAGNLSNIAKLLASEGGYAAVDAAIQCHGGSGFDSECEIHWMQSFLRLLRVAPINTEMILNYVSERMLGLPRSY